MGGMRWDVGLCVVVGKKGVGLVCFHWLRSLSCSLRDKSLSVASTVLRFLCK